MPFDPLRPDLGNANVGIYRQYIDDTKAARFRRLFLLSKLIRRCPYDYN